MLTNDFGTGKQGWARIYLSSKVSAYEAPHITEEIVFQGPDRKKVHEIHDSITNLLLSKVYTVQSIPGPRSGVIDDCDDLV